METPAGQWEKCSARSDKLSLLTTLGLGIERGRRKRQLILNEGP